MASKLVFKSEVHHGVGDKKHVFEKGMECPPEHVKAMQTLGVLDEWLEPSAPKPPKAAAPAKKE